MRSSGQPDKRLTSPAAANERAQRGGCEKRLTSLAIASKREATSGSLTKCLTNLATAKQERRQRARGPNPRSRGSRRMTAPSKEMSQC